MPPTVTQRKIMSIDVFLEDTGTWWAGSDEAPGIYGTGLLASAAVASFSAQMVLSEELGSTPWAPQSS